MRKWYWIKKTKFKILFGILSTIITLITIFPILVNESMAQQEAGITPTDPKNITNCRVIQPKIKIWQLV